MYASDITRTYPANGRFSEPQKDLYEAVLQAQKGVLAQCKAENNVNLQELQATGTSFRLPGSTGHKRAKADVRACRLLEENLRQIGFRLSTGDVQRKGLVSRFCASNMVQRLTV